MKSLSLPPSESANGPVCFLLDLDSFKSSRCRYSSRQCPLKGQCPDFHHVGEQRRPMNFTWYEKLLCPASEACPDPSCVLSHTRTEQIYHPENYKKKFCIFFQQEECPYKVICAYAHSELEFKGKLLHLMSPDLAFLLFQFKSDFCPFKTEHDKFSCVYAHNWQDFKRAFRPWHLPVRCPEWNMDPNLKSYADGCPRAFTCLYCHGWKELEMHPFRPADLLKFEKVVANQSSKSFLPAKIREAFQNLKSPFFDPFEPSLHYQKHSTAEFLESVRRPPPRPQVKSKALSTGQLSEAQGEGSGLQPARLKFGREKDSASTLSHTKPTQRLLHNFTKREEIDDDSEGDFPLRERFWEEKMLKKHRKVTESSPKKLPRIEGEGSSDCSPRESEYVSPGKVPRKSLEVSPSRRKLEKNPRAKAEFKLNFKDLEQL